jgi:hypothetical protein
VLEAAGQEEERARWSVVNISSENFYEITRKLRIDSVEVLVLHTRKNPITIQGPGPKYTAVEDEGYALTTDPRIPREWLLSEPSGCDKEIGRQLIAMYPKNFRASD